MWPLPSSPFPSPLSFSAPLSPLPPLPFPAPPPLLSVEHTYKGGIALAGCEPWGLELWDNLVIKD